MNRKVLFRGKRIDKDEWKYGVPVYNGNRCFLISGAADWSEEFFQPEDWWEVDPETVGQFTGLHDKNGKEIYEGDVVEDKTFYPEYDHLGNEKDFGKETGAVIFKEGSFDVESDRNYSMPLNASKNWEVIGNIHDNPELL